jgi:hypothetical protein
MSNFGLMCAVGGLTLLAIFGAPAEDGADRVSDGGRSARPGQLVEQWAAVAGVALLIAAGILQTGHMW